MTHDTELVQSLGSLEKLKRFSLKIGENLYKRLGRHIQALKYIEIPSFVRHKQEWMELAVREKLERDKNPSLGDLDQKIIHFNLPPELYEEVEKRVEFIKRFRKHYSKKQWFVDALYEKLELEEQSIKSLIEEKLNRSK